MPPKLILDTSEDQWLPGDPQLLGQQAAVVHRREAIARHHVVRVRALAPERARERTQVPTSVPADFLKDDRDSGASAA